MERDERRPGRDQDDVLEHKDHTTKNARGLQQWGSDDAPDEGTGTGGSGTAERANRITEGQRKADQREDDDG